MTLSVRWDYTTIGVTEFRTEKLSELPGRAAVVDTSGSGRQVPKPVAHPVPSGAADRLHGKSPIPVPDKAGTTGRRNDLLERLALDDRREARSPSIRYPHPFAPQHDDQATREGLSEP